MSKFNDMVSSSERLDSSVGYRDQITRPKSYHRPLGHGCDPNEFNATSPRFST